LTESYFSCDVTLFQDGGHYVISCRKVLPPGEQTRSICLSPMQQRSTSS